MLWGQEVAVVVVYVFVGFDLFRGNVRKVFVFCFVKKERAGNVSFGGRWRGFRGRGRSLQQCRGGFKRAYEVMAQRGDWVGDVCG